MEGGFLDRKGKPLHTLQDFLSGKAPYVSVAMDSKAFPYGTKLRIPELEKKYGRPIEFRVVDTGGAFKGKGTSRIDICTANRKASLDPTVNGKLTLIPQR
jgi:3D (Asp-Asp-Asp) domain-containing protein